MKAVVAGGTGLIGSHLLKILEADGGIREVIALTRRKKQNSGKVKWIEVDFENPDELKKAIPKCDLAFCCLGTTMKNAGSREEFQKVDHEYVVNFGRACETAGVKSFSVVSAIGSDKNSGIFYNKVKGLMEKDIEALSIPNIQIFQPSILTGGRKESRIGEKIGIIAMKIASPLMIGAFSKYKPVKAGDVASAMASASREKRGLNRITYKEIQQLS